MTMGSDDNVPGTRLWSLPSDSALYVEMHMLLLTTRSNSSSGPIADSGNALTATLSAPWMRPARVSRSRWSLTCFRGAPIGRRSLSPQQVEVAKFAMPLS